MKLFLRWWYHFMIWGTHNRIAEAATLQERWAMYLRLSYYKARLMEVK